MSLGKLFGNLERAISIGRKMADGVDELSRLTGPAGALAGQPAGRPAAPAKRPGGKLVAVRSLDDRVRLIAKQVRAGHEHPTIIETARMIVSKQCGTPQAPAWCIREHDKRGEAEAVHHWCRANLRYVNDPVKRDTFAHPSVNVRQHAGDCDELIATELAIDAALGIPSLLEVVHERGAKREDLHIFGRVILPEGQLIAVDPTVDQPFGWELPADQVDYRRQYRIF